jgi:hypothetical protein
MSRIVYDIAMLLGTALASWGCAELWGRGAGLLCAGALVIGLTLLGAALSGKR